MSKYRKIHYPKCPYCGYEVEEKIHSYNYSRLVGMATGTGSSDVVIKCEKCQKEYRVTCNIRFYSRQIKGDLK